MGVFILFVGLPAGAFFYPPTVLIVRSLLWEAGILDMPTADQFLHDEMEDVLLWSSTTPDKETIQNLYDWSKTQIPILIELQKKNKKNQLVLEKVIGSHTHFNPIAGDQESDQGYYQSLMNFIENIKQSGELKSQINTTILGLQITSPLELQPDLKGSEKALKSFDVFIVTQLPKKFSFLNWFVNEEAIKVVIQEEILGLKLIEKEKSEKFSEFIDQISLVKNLTGGFPSFELNHPLFKKYGKKAHFTIVGGKILFLHTQKKNFDLTLKYLAAENHSKLQNEYLQNGVGHFSWLRLNMLKIPSIAAFAAAFVGKINKIEFTFDINKMLKWNIASTHAKPEGAQKLKLILDGFINSKGKINDYLKEINWIPDMRVIENKLMISLEKPMKEWQAKMNQGIAKSLNAAKSDEKVITTVEKFLTNHPLTMRKFKRENQGSSAEKQMMTLGGLKPREFEKIKWGRIANPSKLPLETDGKFFKPILLLTESSCTAQETMFSLFSETSIRSKKFKFYPIEDPDLKDTKYKISAKNTGLKVFILTKPFWGANIRLSHSSSETGFCKFEFPPVIFGISHPKKRFKVMDASRAIYN